MVSGFIIVAWCILLLADLIWHNYFTYWFVSMHAEFDALTGSKISALDIGAPAVRMSYSPTSGHTVIAILQVGPA